MADGVTRAFRADRTIGPAGRAGPGRVLGPTGPVRVRGADGAEGPSASEEFDAFYAATAKRLVAAVYAATGDLAEAEDAVQEAYVRAWQRWSRLTREGDPLPWVRTVAMRLAISTWRRTRNRLRAQFRHGPQPDLPGLSADRVELISALRELTPEQRQAVVLHHLLDLPVEQVARETGASSGAVRTRLSRARKILGERLADSGVRREREGVVIHG